MSLARPTVSFLLLFVLLTGFAYPMTIMGLAQLAMPHQANGSLIRNDGGVVGSELVGQNFTADRYFHGRPSATTAPDPDDATKTVDAPYNATNSSGSNLGPTSQKLIDRVKGDVASLAQGKPGSRVPADAVTTSASGLDPDISPANAESQIRRVAQARGLSDDRVRQFVGTHTARPTLGLFGEPRVNVLQLNLALDQAKP